MVLSTINPNQRQLCLQSTRKIGCPAHVVIKHHTLFPEYAIHPDDIEGKSKYNLRLLKEQTLKKLQNDIESGCVKQTIRYWLSLPTLEAVFSQKVNPAVAHVRAQGSMGSPWVFYRWTKPRDMHGHWCKPNSTLIVSIHVAEMGTCLS